MRTFVQNAKTSPQAKSINSIHPGRACVGQSHGVDTILNAGGKPGAAGIARFGHDFSRIPIHRAVAGSIQTKLSINEPGDQHEQEADRVADKVMRMPDPQLQRACACGGKCSDCQAEQDGRIQAKRVQANAATKPGGPSIVHNVLRSPGQPLDGGARGFMESRFGHNFSGVRVHADREAQESARMVQARAYTVGRDIVFGAGEYALDKTEGKRLLAHELVHVVQQGSTSMDGNGDAVQPDDEGKTIALDGGDLEGTRSVGSGSVLQRNGGQSVAPTIRVVTNHQFPLTAANVTAGLLSGNGGVSEMEVSNGTDNFNGQTVTENFVAEGGDNEQVGGCNNASGQGGQGGSTFTIGTGVAFSRSGINVNLPAKPNTFYDVHLKAFGRNILPAGVDHQTSLCVQQYTMGLMTLNGGQVFNRVHNIDRATVSGQDVANIDLVK